MIRLSSSNFSSRISNRNRLITSSWITLILVAIVIKINRRWRVIVTSITVRRCIAAKKLKLIKKQNFKNLKNHLEPLDIDGDLEHTTKRTMIMIKNIPPITPKIMDVVIPSVLLSRVYLSYFTVLIYFAKFNFL